MSFLEPKFLPEHPDLQALALTEQISRDYLDVLREAIIPEIQKTYNLKLREVRLLLGLIYAGRPLSAAALSEFMRQDPATIARSSILLIGGDYVYTTPNLDDARIKNLHLTDKGKAAAEACRQAFDDALEQMSTFTELHNLPQSEEPLTVLKKLERRSSVLVILARRLTKRSKYI